MDTPAVTDYIRVSERGPQNTDPGTGPTGSHGISMSKFETDMVTFNISHDWSRVARRSFYRDPADLVRDADFNPRGVARTLRALAEYQANGNDLNPLGPMPIMASIADPGEQAIGWAGLHRAADRVTHDVVSEHFCEQLDTALGEMPRYRWTASARLNADPEAWAYRRPDHRVRFEVAVRSCTCPIRTQDILAIKDLTFLLHAMLASSYKQSSEDYAEQMITRGSAHPKWRQCQEEMLTARDGHPVYDIARAQAAYQDFRIHRHNPRYRSAASQVRIGDPIYGAFVDLVTPEPGSPLSRAFDRKIGDLAADHKLPAAAELVAFAAEVRPDARADLQQTTARLIAAASRDTPAQRVDALSRLVAAPGLAGLVDPVRLLHDAEHCEPDQWEGKTVSHNAQARLFTVLLSQNPEVALDSLYRAVSRDWPLATLLLERATAQLHALLGDAAAGHIASAMQRGLVCMGDGEPPEIVDGVRIKQLARWLPEG